MTPADTKKAEIATQLRDFVRAQTEDPSADVAEIEPLPGHAGFSYSFILQRHSAGESHAQKLVLRLAPPNVRAAGPADVVRQARVMQSLTASEVPVPPVLWFGDDTRWFGRPYSVVGFVAGDQLTLGKRTFAAEEVHSMVRSLLAAMAALHAVDWPPLQPIWGEPQSLAEELIRLDHLLDRPTLDPQLAARGLELRGRLKSSLPSAPRIGCVHGDLQWTNGLFFEGRLNALIDWELCQVGATLVDLGWLCLFSDPDGWVGGDLVPKLVPTPDGIVDLYEQLAGVPVAPAEIRWFRAFAGYRFGVITLFNLILHRRGKRPDPMWEDIALSAPRLFEHGLELIS
jgi:aminoglycoside phosphotransferase (APT) family kinase protein